MIHIYVPSLVLEVTRRCNMRCAHCLRGDAQTMDISLNTLAFVAKYIEPSEVTFSGGEPSLNIPAIAHYFELAERYHHLPSSFYVITNGKVNQEELAMTLLRAYGKMDEPEMCGVAVSRDIFHDKYVPDSLILKGLSFFRDSHSHPLDETNPQWIIHTGRAENIGYGRRDGYEICESVEDMIEDIYENDGEISVYLKDILYVSSNGLVADQCDVSYEQIDSSALCYIRDFPKLIEQAVKARVTA